MDMKVKPDFNRFNDINFKRIITGFMVVVILGLGFAAYKINEIRTRGYEVFLGETSLGYVREEETALALLNDFNSTLENQYQMEVKFEEELQFQETHIKDDLLVAPAELDESIKEKASYQVKAYTIKIDGEEVGFVDCPEEAVEVLEEIKEPYIENTEENVTVVEADFLEEVEIADSYIDVEEIVEKTEIVEQVKTGGEEIETHIVEAGESYWTIAKMYEVEPAVIVEANPGIEEATLYPGDPVAITVATALATVVTTEEEVATEAIDFEVIVEKDDSMYEDEKKVKVEGVAGSKEVTYYHTKHNGERVETQVIVEEVLEEPVAQVVVQGTKERPKTMATGSFMVPTRGRISSNYGMRWGRMHRGMDFAASTGTPILAADGGVVTHAGYQGSYGYMVEVNHENGYKTRYAHCSKMHVKVGQRVYKGEHIANIGNTGRSTGPHLHFEVLVNGTQKNPSGFIY